jgi:(1->4)-alpha-D-glucan 1-alpha-D-glucosylmutase
MTDGPPSIDRPTDGVGVVAAVDTPPPSEGDGEAQALLQDVAAALRRERRATYRLQLGPGLGFEDVAALGEYLDELGVSEAYLSPCFRAGPGSSHGYDVTDHNAFNPEIGDSSGFHRMAETLGRRGLGVLLDVVPNHMGIVGDSNPWWLDVLENGPSSPYAAFFDIDWAPVKAELRHKVLLPVLPDQYGRILESGQLVLEQVEGGFFVCYAGARLPIAPRTFPQILTHGLERVEERLGPDHPHLLELHSILTAIDHLPPQTEMDPARLTERFREKQIIKRRLATLLKESPDVCEVVGDSVRAFNGTPGEPASFDLLDRLLSAQAYRLADWRVAGDEINYRRFFDVNHLAAIRMELPQVFEATHALVLGLVGEGRVTGLRVDHPDGLYAPGEYFRRLQEEAVTRVARRLRPEISADALDRLLLRYRRAAEEEPEAARARPLWVLAEKILTGDERLPEWWAVAGTTGYDFLASVNGLLVDRAGLRPITAAYRRFVGPVPKMADLAYASKRLIMQVSMASEINELGHHLDRISETNRRSRDFTLNSLTGALREVIACFPVYRTYVGDRGGEVSARDRAYIERAVAEAARRNPQINVSIFDFLRDALLLRVSPGDGGAAGVQDFPALRHFVMRFQQLTGPVTAKGVEDTALYRYNRLLSLSEVGSDPARFGEPVAAFHAKNAERLARWPDSLLTTSTHDTKRGEDVRARVAVLSEVSGEWEAAVRRWRRLNRRSKVAVHGESAPDRDDEYFLYQTLIGAWPVDEGELWSGSFTTRLTGYMEKATKEAKRQTSWINPSVEYDDAVRAFVAALLVPGGPFVDAFRPFQARVARHGMLNSLAQTVLKLAAPGIPDLYQGAELWDLSLVDPDNRRPVDFARRRALVADLRATIAATPDRADLCRDLLDAWPDGRVKLYAILRALDLRRARAALFGSGAYLSLEAQGDRKGHVVAFARMIPAATLVAVVPRLTVGLGGFGAAAPLGPAAWGDTWLSLGDPALGGTYADVFTARTLVTEERDGRPGLSLGDVFAHFPVALLAGGEGAVTAAGRA